MPPDTAHAKAGAVPGHGEAGVPHARLPPRPSPSPGLFPEVLVPTSCPPPSCPDLCSKPRVPKADLEPLEVSPSLNFASSGSVGAGGVMPPGGHGHRAPRTSSPRHLSRMAGVPLSPLTSSPASWGDGIATLRREGSRRGDGRATCGHGGMLSPISARPCSPGSPAASPPGGKIRQPLSHQGSGLRAPLAAGSVVYRIIK